MLLYFSLGNYRWRKRKKQRKNIFCIISSYYQLRLLTAVAIVFDFSRQIVLPFEGVRCFSPVDITVLDHQYFQDRKWFSCKKIFRQTEDDMQLVKMSFKYSSYQLMTCLNYSTLLFFCQHTNLSFDHTCRQTMYFCRLFSMREKTYAFVRSSRRLSDVFFSLSWTITNDKKEKN